MRERVRVEPSAGQRSMANVMYANYMAFRDAGFSESQAMQMVTGMLDTMLRPSPPDPTGGK